MNLTTNERRVLSATLQNALDCSGGDFAFTDEVVVMLEGEQSAASVGGTLSRLQSKGLIWIDLDDHPACGSHQVTLSDEIQKPLYAGASPDEIIASVTI